MSPAATAERPTEAPPPSDSSAPPAPPVAFIQRQRRPAPAFYALAFASSWAGILLVLGALALLKAAEDRAVARIWEAWRRRRPPARSSPRTWWRACPTRPAAPSCTPSGRAPPSRRGCASPRRAASASAATGPALRPSGCSPAGASSGRRPRVWGPCPSPPPTTTRAGGGACGWPPSAWCRSSAPPGPSSRARRSAAWWSSTCGCRPRGCPKPAPPSSRWTTIASPSCSRWAGRRLAWSAAWTPRAPAGEQPPAFRQSGSGRALPVHPLRRPDGRGGDLRRVHHPDPHPHGLVVRDGPVPGGLPLSDHRGHLRVTAAPPTPGPGAPGRTGRRRRDPRSNPGR